MTKAITIKKNAVASMHNKIKNAASNAQGVLARDIYGYYQEHQAKRFASVSSNSGGVTSEGDNWPGLKQGPYRKYKPRRFAAYPESGLRLMVATGSLAKVAVGQVRALTNPESDQTLYHRRIVSKDSLIIGISGDYVKPVNKARPFMKFGRVFWGRVKSRLKEYFMWRR
jgi:hypothetical protein